MSSRCGCKEVCRFPHITYPYSSCICSFLQQHPTFFSFFLYVFRYLGNKWNDNAIDVFIKEKICINIAMSPLKCVGIKKLITERCKQSIFTA